MEKKKTRKKQELQTQPELEKIPRATMQKNMRNLEDILADIVADPDIKLDDNEQRLVDRHLFEKTGKHFGKFKTKKGVSRKSMVVISSDGNKKGQREVIQPEIRHRNDPPIVANTPEINAGASPDPQIS